MKIEPKTVRIDDSVVLFDQSHLAQVDLNLFAADHWAALDQLETTVGGRGAAWFVGSTAQPWVLRHYQRGGLAARVARDRYLYLGEQRVRAFAEWRLLAQMYERGLPVPRPVAARYRRRGLSYGAPRRAIYSSEQRAQRFGRRQTGQQDVGAIA